MVASLKVLNESQKDLYRLCPRCGNFVHISQPDVFCIVCGEKLITECRHCGEPIRYPTAKFCPVCGEGYGGKF